MKNRFIRWCLHFFWKYTASTRQVTDLEAKRYCNYLTDNYSELEQLFILKELHKALIDFRENQIKNTEIEVIQKIEKVIVLNKNLDKLIKAL
jgi:hypothetical protein